MVSTTCTVNGHPCTCTCTRVLDVPWLARHRLGTCTCTWDLYTVAVPFKHPHTVVQVHMHGICGERSIHTCIPGEWRLHFSIHVHTCTCTCIGHRKRYPLYTKQCRVYSGTSLLRTPWGCCKVSCIERCPHFRGEFLLRQHIWDVAKCP